MSKIGAQRILRRAIIIVLGAVLIYDSIANQFHVVEFVVGIIMVGLVPVDVITDTLMPTSNNDEAQIERLRQVMREDKKEGDGCTPPTT